MNAFDQALLLRINGAHTPLLDNLMWQVSQSRFTLWIVLYFLLLALICVIYKGDRRAAQLHSWWPLIGALLAIALSVGLADYISSGILKPVVGRLRPTHDPCLASLLHTVNGYRGGQYGFPSSHAANTMAVSVITLLLLWERRSQRIGRIRLGQLLLPLAIALLLIYVLPNCYSRIYLGVHYPTDILAGMAIGAITAIASFALFKLFIRKIHTY